MTWFKVDDGFADHPKVIARLAGSYAETAIALWVICGAWCAKHLTDGFVPVAHIRRSGFRAADKAAAELVRVGLWEVVEGGYQVKGWDEYQPTRAKVEADREANADKVRRHRSRNVDKKQTILSRCGARCHHCGTSLSLSSMTIDHLIPRHDGGSTSAENLVSSCISCNSKKGKRQLVTGYTCQCVTGYVPVTDEVVKPVCNRLPSRPDPSVTGDPLATLGPLPGVREFSEVSAGQVRTRFQALFEARFNVAPYMGGGEVIATFPARLRDTAAKKGVDVFELLGQTFEAWAARPLDEISQNAPYAAFAARFGSLCSPKGLNGSTELDDLHDAQIAALKAKDHERYRSLVDEERRRSGKTGAGGSK